MSIRHKSMISVLSILFILVTALYSVISSTLLDGFGKIEEKDTSDNVERLRNAFVEQYSELEMKAQDWAHFDDAFEYIKKPNEEFIESNFTNAGYTVSRLNLMAYLGLDGTLIYGRQYDYSQKKQVPLLEPLKQLIAIPKIAKHSDANEITKGLFMLSDGPFIAASVPVTNSNVESPHNGTVVFGRYFNDKEANILAEKTRLKVSFAASVSQAKDKKFEGYIRDTNRYPIKIVPDGQEVITGLSYIKDFDSNIGLYYKVDVPRKIHKEALAALRLTLIVLVASSIVFGLVIYLLVDTLIVARVRFINEQLQAMIAKEEYDKPLPIDGNDEISNFIESINGLLAAESEIVTSYRK